MTELREQRLDLSNDLVEVDLGRGVLQVAVRKAIRAEGKLLRKNPLLPVVDAQSRFTYRGRRRPLRQLVRVATGQEKKPVVRHVGEDAHHTLIIPRHRR
jgi:hypothetical protein